MLLLTVRAPDAPLIANIESSFPLSISHPPPDPIASPVVAIVRTAALLAAFSARLAELAVIAISTSVTVIVNAST